LYCKYIEPDVAFNPIAMSGKWFWSCICGQFAAEAGNAEESCAPAREECNKYDLTAAPCFSIGQT
jgi:hypothetical protein